MGKDVRIIHLDDVRDESDIIEHVMQKSDLNIHWKWVASKHEYLHVLRDFKPDIVLSDHSMPEFSSVEAFRMLREERLDIPFILVTATVSEEFAVMMMKEGVADYVLKDRLQRLPAAVENALDKWEAERNNRAFVNQIIRSQANLNAIMENSAVSIYSLDRSFRYITFNSYLKDSLKRAFNMDIKPGDIVFEFLNKLDPSQASDWQEVYVLALQGVAQQFVKEFTIGNQKNYQQFYVNPIREGEVITGLACFATDITKEKTAELNLARSESKFRALIENNYDAIVVRDENRKLVYVSNSVGRVLGYTSAEILANEKLLEFNSHDVPLIEWLFENIKHNPDIPFPVSVRLKHRKGHYIWIEGVITNMLENPSVRGVVVNWRDITERKENELYQAKMTRDLVQRNQDLEQFAYIVSHNLRGPIANILGISNILKYPEINEEDRSQAMKGIFSATANLDEVIRDLNLILQTKQGAEEKKEPINLHALVFDVQESISDMIEKNGARIVTDFSNAPEIVSIPSFIRSIFHNLITNSIKYRRPDVPPLIRISSQKVGDCMQLVFSDNGVGIDMTSQGNKLFGLYKRFHPTLAEGKGMGLFMVKTQVESLGGEIRARSEVNVGTEFTIDL